MPTTVEDFIKMLNNYIEDAKILRQIHQNKTFRNKKFNTRHTVITIIISSFLSLLGFRGLESIRQVFNLTKEHQIRALEFVFSILIFLFFILAILKLVFRFEEKYNHHSRSVVILSGFIRDIKDIILMNEFEERQFKNINKEIRERYKMITEILPPSSDKEHRIAKEDYFKKKLEKEKLNKS